MVSIEKLKQLKDKVAIIGIGETDYNNDYKFQREAEKKGVPVSGQRYPDGYGLIATAFKRAVADAGIEKELINGLGVSEVPSVERVGELLGVNSRWSYMSDSANSIIEAALAINSGAVDYIAIVQGNNQRTARTHYGGPNAMGSTKYLLYSHWAPWGFTSQGALYAMMFKRYVHKFNQNEEKLGAVSVAQRKHASMNPNAVMQKPITMDNYISAPYITEPLRLYDYCLINDGGTAIIVTSKENAESFKHPPVYLTSFGRSEANRDSTIMKPRLEDFYKPDQKVAAEQAYSMAGITRKEIDALEIYDSFSCHIPLALEGFGFTENGKGLDFIQDGNIEVDGELPVNTGGGHLSESYMRGWNHQLEAVRQLRGEAGKRQVENAKYVQYISSVAGKIVTLIYRRD